MFKKISIVFLISILALTANAQSSKNINLLSNLTFPGGRGDLNDIWGVKKGANEYALVGFETGVAIVDVTTPTNPVEVFFAPGANTTWRDLKTWNNHVYITNENSGGMMIIDINPLPGALTAANVTSYGGSSYTFESAHNLYIDENGVCYIFGADNGLGGAIMLDLTNNPKAPIELGRYDTYYFHDGVARGDTLWGAAVNDGVFVVVDVTNKNAPTTLATQPTSSFFSHNIWFSDDGQTVFTTDEKKNAFIDAYDVSNLTNITFLDKIQSSPGQDVIPHNTHFFNNYLITSYYRDGVIIHDVSDPSNIIEVGHYDTSPQYNGDGFNGCWGAYPWLPSGVILASDMENGLFVLGPNYVRAAYLIGNITNLNTSTPISGANVEILTTTNNTTSNLNGDYRTGIADAGTYDVVCSKFGFIPDTIFNVVLTSGQTTTINVQLDPIQSFNLNGQIIENTTNTPIPNAQIRFSNSQFSTTVTTNASGNFTINNFVPTIYDVHIAQWGHQSVCLSNQNINSTGNPYTYSMAVGYYDDFDFDLGWTTSTLNNPTAGFWVRDVPMGTFLNGVPVNPANDINNDCGDKAYITGNGGGQAGTDDIDDGTVILTSPIFDLSSSIEPYIHFYRWFVNGGGSGNPDDSIVVILTNGINEARLDYADANTPDFSTWVHKSFKVTNFLPLTANMQLIVKATDEGQGHISEAGFDGFVIYDSALVSVNKIQTTNIIKVYPNPFNEVINIAIESNDYKTINVEIFDITGKTIYNKTISNSNVLQIKADYSSGIYFIKIFGDTTLLKTKKLVKF